MHLSPLLTDNLFSKSPSISNSSPVIPISESTSRSHDNVVDATKAWENTHPIPKASDELEQINQ
ncbi:MAG: hypothetical protein PT118_04620 [Aphanizomenon gracile PMC644.10]|nr:hypothetical protein [Aphanizomenon gracile PMC638.10]MDM3851619.1 hypothetical protein [Aphanizomenon gracile PMC627.10]MDM3859123.1 hypothetical protein [Aphanizomenon gracile PMC644.10]